jgi:hypothetical protein
VQCKWLFGAGVQSRVTFHGLCAQISSSHCAPESKYSTDAIQVKWSFERALHCFVFLSLSEFILSFVFRMQYASHDQTRGAAGRMH